MMKVLLLALLLPLCCVQQEYHPEKIWLFSKVEYTGNIPADRNGKHLLNRPVKLVCYLRVGNKIKVPDWQTALIYGNQYSVEAMPVTGDSVAVGTLKNSQSAVNIKAGSGSKLVQLVFTLQGKIEKPEAWQFILNGTLNGKSVYIRSNDPMVELSPDLMP
jgi:hypothetical protein